MPIDVEFINFDDLKKGLDPSIRVIINAGDRDTSWSGGEHWKDPETVCAIRRFVHEGGGFIGVGEPSACQHQGAFFQLRDVLGVDEEVGFTMSTDKYNTCIPEHFITEEQDGPIDFGEGKNRIYAWGSNYQILAKDGEYTELAVNAYGKGRAAYFAGLPYSPANCRLLLRTLYWVCSKEGLLKQYYVSNPETEIAVYEKNGIAAVINNSEQFQTTVLTIHGIETQTLQMKPREMIWIDLNKH